MYNRQNIIRITSWIAVLVAGAVTLALPFGYFTVSYQNLLGSLEAEAETTSLILSDVINANPEMWQYESIRLEELLQRRLRHKRQESKRILDLQNIVIAQNDTVVKSPLVTQNFDLLDAGSVVGRLEIRSSLYPLLLRTGFVSLLGFAFGIVIFIVLRTLPLRAVAQAEKSLRESEERYRLLVENAPNAIVVHDNDLLFYANNAARQLFGAERIDQLVGQPFLSIIHPDNREFLEHLQRTEDDVIGGLNQVLRLTRFDGTPINAVAVGIRVSYKGHPAVQTILHDVTELQRLQDELSEKVVKLEAALANVSLLEGIIPICSYCKKIRDDRKSWHQIENYISSHSEAKFSHGICPECLEIEMKKIELIQKTL